MKHPFTRVELVCIVTVSVLLVALVIPATGRAAAGAGTAKCLEQLSRLNQGLNLYADANSDYYPADYPVNYQVEWAGKIAPFVGVEAKPEAPAAAFICPDDTLSANLTYNDLRNKKSSYGINGYGVCWDHQTGRGVRRAQVKNPDMIVLADAPGWLIVGYAGEGPGRIPTPRHEEGKAVNVLFFNGAAETVNVNVSKPADIYQEENLPAAYWYRTI